MLEVRDLREQIDQSHLNNLVILSMRLVNSLFVRDFGPISKSWTQEWERSINIREFLQYRLLEFTVNVIESKDEVDWLFRSDVTLAFTLAEKRY